MSNKNTKKPKTKNDIAWEALFEKYSILEKIHEIGYFEIESNSINEFRESRLMAKFDHYDTLPTIFEKNNETADRRSSTVRRWIEWILSVISDE
ncbi:hypothetical protein PN471_18065 [Aphanizomenon sp. CS-733/32]|uniref:type II restriction enzyme n=1 Tax=Aphanizomenon sp. CS-733/32 TaxID=3021715 RepID=UPI00233088CC|nr:hypothetical protein [Aphanizomenon sp. CS-733/32]MDB9310495.1 hypothetical protein [Aphanizomenon sp. CS-733/32]